ncbi:MAG: lecithin retinol acyltransferase family protein [Clostridia bacterium]|nr:lecithin retinol acyltransferase family protein [Clostridia bacterium]MBQ7302057.1 lecithin retinol acyltransferase family protein [Clostridia bacterium]
MLRVKVSFYYHYGVCVDEDRVVQFGLPDNVSTPTEQIAVIETDMAAFAGDGIPETAVLTFAERRRRLSPKKTVEAARARLGETGYHIFRNNCEHFAHACVFGEATSPFVDDVRESLRKKLQK